MAAFTGIVPVTPPSKSRQQYGSKQPAPCCCQLVFSFLKNSNFTAGRVFISRLTDVRFSRRRSAPAVGKVRVLFCLSYSQHTLNTTQFLFCIRLVLLQTLLILYLQSFPKCPIQKKSASVDGEIPKQHHIRLYNRLTQGYSYNDLIHILGS